jgi:hypothetical protein
MVEEEIKNDGAAGAKPEGAHTRQGLDWAWHTITEYNLLLMQANALAHKIKKAEGPLRAYSELSEEKYCSKYSCSRLCRCKHPTRS